MSECSKLRSLIEECEGVEGEGKGGGGEWHRLISAEARECIVAFLSGKSTNLEVGGACCSGNCCSGSFLLP